MLRSFRLRRQGAMLAGLFACLAGISQGLRAAPEQADKAVNSGDTAWILVSAAMVLLMTPALAFFYGGMVRAKNMLNTLLLSLGAAAVIGVAWLLLGYSLAFGEGNPWCGGLQYFGLRGVGLDGAPLAPTVPHQAFMIYQAMFAIITPALISGAVVERVKFTTFMVFMLLWSLLVYSPVAHWFWGGGWLQKMGALDFAGGAVVHITAGFSALVCALVVGPRREYRVQPLRPHNLPFTLLGAGLLWFGWFGFNAGSALSSGQLSTVAFVNTNTAGATAMLVWMLLDQITRKEITALGAATGAIAGLAGVTPSAGFVTPLAAIAIGAIISAVCYLSATLRAKSKLDDSLDAFAVHGVGGLFGTLLTGVFVTGALTGINAAAKPGLLEGGVATFTTQLFACAVTVVYSMAVTFVLLKVLDAVMGLRVGEEDEHRGLDIAAHGEEAYAE